MYVEVFQIYCRVGLVYVEVLRDIARLSGVEIQEAEKV